MLLSNLLRPRQVCNEVVQPQNGPYCVQVRCISNKIWTQLTPFFICSASFCGKVLDRIIARMLCFMHQGFFRPNYIFYNDAFFLDFRARKFPLSFFLI